MDYILSHTSEIGFSLFLFICIYFLFRIGIRLVEDDLGDYTFWAWILLIIGIFWGMNFLNQKNPLGFLGFIPALTYILLKILRGINFDYKTQSKVKGVVFSGIASSITYAVTHTVFGFGIPEASITALLAAGILGAVGYTA
ncbi:hypothetical protein [Leucothrix mucor]|uniref:hypothetical protein n=1 Tax=Leucothrix mucor TaxID=45248 RepID=UPI0003B79B21|nr:hypothetical protein [Leucothrix mucor]